MLGNKNKKFGGSSFFQANMIGIVILVGLVSFLLGNRWSEILDSFGVETTSSAEQNAELPADLTYSEVEELYDVLRQEFDGDLTEEQILDGLKHGLADSTGDVYTTYFNQEEAESFNNDLNGTFTGIGAELGINDDGQLIIVAPIKGFPAESAGVRAQDIIVEVDGEESIDWPIERAVSTIRGPEGSEVKLTLARSGERVEVTIVRQQISLPSVEHEILEGNIGYINMSRFSEDTARLAENAVAGFKENNVQKVILDLRNNSGGLLNASVDVAGLWAQNVSVVEQRAADGTNIPLMTGSSAPLAGIETVVLVNGGSASASEIVAGALQDLNLATVVGSQTFGKGSVQSLETLPNGGLLKVTIARWYTPSGRSIDQEGVTPDEIIEPTEEDIVAERDVQREKAIELLAD